MVQLGQKPGVGDDEDEYERARVTVLLRVLEDGEPLHAVKAAMGMVRMMRVDDTPFGRGFAQGLLEVETMVMQGGVAYLREIPQGHKVAAFVSLGFNPVLQRVLDYFRRTLVYVDCLWVKVEADAMYLAAPGLEGAVCCRIARVSCEDEDQGSGFCYLGIIRDQYVAGLKELLGPYPTFEQVLMMPSKCLVQGWDGFPVAKSGGGYHVPVTGGVGLGTVFSELAQRRDWPGGTIGAFARSLGSSAGCVESGDVPGLDSIIGGSGLLAGYLVIGITVAAYLSVHGVSVVDSVCLSVVIRSSQ